VQATSITRVQPVKWKGNLTFFVTINLKIWKAKIKIKNLAFADGDGERKSRASPHPEEKTVQQFKSILYTLADIIRQL